MLKAKKKKIKKQQNWEIDRNNCGISKLRKQLMTIQTQGPSHNAVQLMFRPRKFGIPRLCRRHLNTGGRRLTAREKTRDCGFDGTWTQPFKLDDDDPIGFQHEGFHTHREPHRRGEM